MAEFREVFAAIGMDEKVSPATIVVPVRGANVFALSDATGLNVVANPPLVKITEFNGTSINAVRDSMRTIINSIRPDYAAVYLPPPPSLLTGQPRFFAIQGAGQATVTVQVSGGSSGAKNGQLRVAVVDQLVFKLAIRNIVVRDQNGSETIHSNNPGDANKELETINVVWKPQTNIVFELVSSAPLVVDLRRNPLKTRWPRLWERRGSRLAQGFTFKSSRT